VNFNGKDALVKGGYDLQKKKKDNYLEVLPIYYYPPKNELTSAFPSLDRAIEKASKSVFKHSILQRGIEYVKTMDDAYMMMGKAYFLKQDYNEAKRVFNYITSSYQPWGSIVESTIWLARCEMQQGYFVRAQIYLEEISQLISENNNKSSSSKTTSKANVKNKVKIQKKFGKKSVSKDVKLQYYAAEAEYNLLAPNGEIEDAIDFIKLALHYKPKKSFKVRLYFILGQLYEKLDDKQAAQYWFRKVIKATPDYDMEFSARMHLAVNYDGTSLSKKMILKELNKMLGDSKNEDYKDQIYYAISEIARIDSDEAERANYLAKSVTAFTNNDYQRTFSAVTLADIFFQQEEYVKAQAYYDTTLLSLPQNFPNHEAIIQKSSILRDLVDNLNIIQLQDSLQRIAKMSDTERRTWVAKMIAIYTEEERRLAKEEADRLLVLGSALNFANVNVNTQGQSNKWYFYNPGLVAQGITEFYRRFGNRKLEDNWRISNKSVMSFEDMADFNAGVEKQEEEELDEFGNPVKKRETDPKKPEYYTQDLPLTPQAIDSSNNLIVSAMYNAGIIYFDQLSDLKRSNEMLQKLIQRFPGSDLVLPAYFILWSNNTKLKNAIKANEAKNYILTHHPDSDYAKLILDPDYYKKLAETAKENERRYEQLYQAYKAKQWESTVQLADELLGQTREITLKSKIAYLRAVAVGQLEDQEILRNALKQIIKEFPKEEVAELAKIYLSTLSALAKTSETSTQGIIMSDPVTEGGTVSMPKESPFNTNIDEMHYIIVLVDVHSRTVNELKYDIDTFNSTFFSLERFNINSFYINQNQQLVTIARFKGKTDAMNYHTAMTTYELFSYMIKEKNIIVYAISATNYSIYYAKPDDRNMYGQFFEENYLK
jgi:tetratricopeptide (TPR) repeat protein